MNTDLPIIKFNPKLPRLSEGEKKILKLFIEVGELVSPLYAEQEKQLRSISRDDIEKVAMKDSSALSPYTVVEKVDNKIVVTPYHIKYEKFLKPISDRLEKAARITHNKELANALRVQARALLDGSYDKATIAWLKIKPYILDISVGPVEHFDNELFSAKAVYQCWVGVVDSEGTKRLNDYKKTILGARKGALIPGERVENYENVKAKTLDVILFSGFMAQTKFVGVNMPMNLQLVEKYGSEVTIFNQTNDFRMQEQILPTFEKIFSKEFRKSFTAEDLRRGSLRYVALHELAHNYLYYKQAKDNLQDLLPCIYELTATLLGMRIAGSLLLKGVINEKQLESMIVAFICRSIYLIEQSKEKKFMINYATGGAIFINYMIESDALRQKNGIAIPNFMKIFVSLHELSFVLERLLSSGTRVDAQAFIEKYGYLKRSSSII